MPESQTRRYSIVVEYDGGDFVGWQLQPNGRSVQGVLESALQKLFSTAVRVHGAGRTDAGVHATGQVAHFDIALQLDGDTMVRALNAALPPDITVHEAAQAADDFHARFSASSRSYRYTIAHARNSLHRRTQWMLYAGIDHEAIIEAVPHLQGTHDFTSFSKRVPELEHHYCHVFDVGWENAGEVTRFTIKANRFLQGMVRCLVGGLVQVGRHKLSPRDFAALLGARDRRRAPMLAPPQGLVLTAVNYDAAERATVQGIMEDLRKERGE
ncbi:MAG: tRNA pseudouridine(38-40) synthase TruA [Bacteroidota bacterium]|nr:tRNA pseudouridine(38-40) synthase TruA [Bacteroidota bacterium]